MRIECLKDGDADLGRERKAIFAGQFYELPGEIAGRLIASGMSRAVVKAQEPVMDKAVHGPEETKVRRGRRES